MDIEAARSDFDAAEKLDPKDIVHWRGRGFLAARLGRPSEAVEGYSQALAIDPTDLFALGQRAEAYAALKDYPRALADLDAALKAHPEASDIHAMKAAVYSQMQQPAKASAEAALYKAESHDDRSALQLEVATKLEAGDGKGARAAADRLVVERPDANAYLIRSQTREVGDDAGREADMVAAQALDPKNVDVLGRLAAARAKAKDYAGALRWSDKLIVQAPDRPMIWIDRAQYHVRVDRVAEAASDFATARAKAMGDGVMLNEVCRTATQLGIALEDALEACDDALKIDSTDANALDSRGLVLLKLGRNEEAVKAYDLALKVRPGMSSSMYGRGLAEVRLDRKTAAARDLAAASASNAAIEKIFAGYGVTH